MNKRAIIYVLGAVLLIVIVMNAVFWSVKPKQHTND